MKAIQNCVAALKRMIGRLFILVGLLAVLGGGTLGYVREAAAYSGESPSTSVIGSAIPEAGYKLPRWSHWAAFGGGLVVLFAGVKLRKSGKKH
jgi:hypothetical protein